METFIVQAHLALPVVAAIVLGFFIGIQRRIWHRTAGPRTYALVAGGSALFTVLSTYAFGGDVARVSAGIVTGVGFLGAGTIMRKEDHIEGLTTAAGLWTAAAIGMACGVGYYYLALLVALLSFLVLMIWSNKWDEEKCKKKK